MAEVTSVLGYCKKSIFLELRYAFRICTGGILLRLFFWQSLIFISKEILFFCFDGFLRSFYTTDCNPRFGYDLHHFLR